MLIITYKNEFFKKAFKKLQRMDFSVFFAIDKARDFGYNISIISAQNRYGAAMVSTGVLRHDKRGGPNNPVKLFNLKNKRQQHCCSCSVSCDAAISAARTAWEDYDPRRASNQ